MGIVSTIRKAILGDDIQSKSLNSQYAYNGMTFIPIDNVGNYTTLTSINTAYSQISIVYKIVNHIAQRVSEALIELYERKKDGQQIENSDFLYHLEDPNPVQSQSDLLFELSMYCDLAGEFYIWVEPEFMKTAKGFQNLWCMPPSLITRINDSYYQFRNVNIPKEQIWHYRRPVPNYRADDITTALSPLAVAYPQIKVIDYANATSQKTLGNGAVPGVAYVKQKDNMEALSPEAIKELKDFLVRRYTSRETYGEVPLVGEEIGFTPFGINPKDALIIEQIKMNEEGIANAFGYPLPLLHNKTGGLNSSERQDAMKELLTAVVFPRLDKICGILTKILNEKGQIIKYDKYAYPEMEDDWNTLSQSLERMPFLSWNEKRKIMNFGPLTDKSFDLPFIPNNITTIDEFMNVGTSNDDVLPNDGDFN